MTIQGNINDKSKGIFDDNGAMQISAMSGGTKATGNINDMEHSSIIESAGKFIKSIFN